MIFRMLRHIRKGLRNHHQRDDFVVGELKKLTLGTHLLDAGCGSQRYRSHCDHLVYKSQDFGKVGADQKPGLAAANGYQYGQLDYVGDIWAIDERDCSFDAILCTEVLEHVPFPIETIREFYRLLKPGGRLILTAPSNCLRHMDPYFFYSGFSDRFFEKILYDAGFSVENLQAVGDYYRWMAVELARTATSHSILVKLLLLPAFFYYFFKRPTPVSVNTLCVGYHITAVKVSPSPSHC
jgi:SAM-dependent methyltransferase